MPKSVKSVATKTGDTGTTSLLYGERVLKSDSRIELVGQIDELSAFLGLAKAELTEYLARNSIYLSVESCPVAYDVIETLKEVQLKFIEIMGEIATEDDKKSRYEKGFGIFDLPDLEKLDRRIHTLETEYDLTPTDWVLYGCNKNAAALDVASKVCRRVERVFWMKSIHGTTIRPVILKYINRLSDYLYLCARFFEKK
jgi:cob(I)alamin adenosyltransferase